MTKHQDTLHFNTLADYLTWAEAEFTKHDLFFGHGTDNAWDEAVMIVIEVLQLSLDVNKSLLTYKLSKKQTKQLIALTNQRCSTKEPLPYLLGYTWYAYEKYLVTKDTIIPRSPIYELILTNAAKLDIFKASKILDLCTGSGALAIVAAQQYTNATVFGLDISVAALEVANQNKELHNVEDVTFLQSNLYAAIDDNTHYNTFDLIITNPPYVSETEYQELPPEYHYEPKIALTAPDDGLALVYQILKHAPKFLNATGKLILEVGYSYPQLQRKIPNLAKFEVIPDCGGTGIYVFSAAELQKIVTSAKL